MALLKQFTTPNGVVVSYHKIIKVELIDNSPTLQVQIGSWPSEEVCLSGVSPIWNSYIQVPSNDLYLVVQDKLLLSQEFSNSSILMNAGGLVAAKIRKWAEIKAIRDEREFKGMAFEGVLFDSNLVSQSRIQGAVILAMQDPNYTVTWTLQDNTTKQLTAPQVIALGKRLAEHIEELYSQSQVLRNRLDAATTIPEVEAIFW